MQIRSPYRPPESAISRFLRHYGLSSLIEMQAKVSDLLSNQYGLGVLSFDTFKPAICLRVTTNKGSFYFKTFDPDLNSIDDLMDLVDYLRDQGIPLPRVLPTENGCRAAVFQGRPAYLSEISPGSAIDPTNKDHAVLSAKALAAFHGAGAGYHPQTNGGAGCLWGRLPLASDISESLPKLWQWIKANRIAERPEMDLCKKAEHILKGAMHSSALGSPLPKTYIHGDYKPCHVFHEDGRVSGLIDFDFAGHGERLRDVCSMLGSLDHEGDSHLSFGNQQRFVEEYRRFIPLTPIEESILPLISLWGNFCRIATLAEWQNRGLPALDSRLGAAISDMEAALTYYFA